MLQLRVFMLQLNTLHAARKIKDRVYQNSKSWYRQINFFFFKSRAFYITSMGQAPEKSQDRHSSAVSFLTEFTAF